MKLFYRYHNQSNTIFLITFVVVDETNKGYWVKEVILPQFFDENDDEPDGSALSEKARWFNPESQRPLCFSRKEDAFQDFLERKERQRYILLSQLNIVDLVTSVHFSEIIDRNSLTI